MHAIKNKIDDAVPLEIEDYPTVKYLRKHDQREEKVRRKKAYKGARYTESRPSPPENPDVDTDWNLPLVSLTRIACRRCLLPALMR